MAVGALRKARSAPAAVSFGVLVAAFGLSSSPARASHNIVITHTPPTTATAGTPLVLQLSVEATCGRAFGGPPFVVAEGCDPAEVKATWIQTGSPRSTAPVRSAGKGETLALVVPGDAVSGPTFSYWITASQTAVYAGTGPGCLPPIVPVFMRETLERRSPASGTHDVPVSAAARSASGSPTDRRPSADIGTAPVAPITAPPAPRLPLQGRPAPQVAPPAESLDGPALRLGEVEVRLGPPPGLVTYAVR